MYTIHQLILLHGQALKLKSTVKRLSTVPVLSSRENLILDNIREIIVSPYFGKPRLIDLMYRLTNNKPATLAERTLLDLIKTNMVYSGQKTIEDEINTMCLYYMKIYGNDKEV